MTGWALAVDFGTSNTAAAVLWGGGSPEPLRLSDQADQMPSGVLVRADGTKVAGEYALNEAGAFPERFVDRPKQWVGRGGVEVAGQQVGDVQLVAAVYAEVAAKARHRFGGQAPERVVVTFPVGWQDRTGVLLEAAASVEWGSVEAILEPEAAVRFFAHHPRVAPAPGPVAVFDLGGGTCDVAVLQPRGGGEFEVVAHAGRTVGGEDFDRKLVEMVVEAVRARGREDVAARLAGRQHPGELRTLLEQVRRAKRRLSEHHDATVSVPPGLAGEEPVAPVTVTRSEFEGRIEADLQDTTEALAEALADAGVAPHQLGQLYLTGGSVAIPRVQELIEARLELSHTNPPGVDPKLVTAQGALHTLARPQQQLSPAAERMLAKHPRMRSRILEHRQARESLSNPRILFALASMPDLRQRALEDPTTLAMQPLKRTFEPRPFPITEGSTPPVIQALFSPHVQEALNANSDVRTLASTPQACWRLITATPSELHHIDNQPAALRDLLGAPSEDALPDWVDDFVTTMRADEPRPLTSRRAAMASLTSRRVAMGSGILGVAALAIFLLLGLRDPYGAAPTYGVDASLDIIWDYCEQGELDYCDTLYEAAPASSGYLAFGEDCGGHDGVRPCAGDYGDSRNLDDLYDGCDEGDLVDCDELYEASLAGTEYYAFAAACGYRGNDSPPCGVLATPDLTGMTYDEARAELEDLGLSTRRREEESGQPEGTVIDTDPVHGTELRAGDAVMLVIAEAEEEAYQYPRLEEFFLNVRDGECHRQEPVDGARRVIACDFDGFWVSFFDWTDLAAMNTWLDDWDRHFDGFITESREWTWDGVPQGQRRIYRGAEGYQALVTADKPIMSLLLCCGTSAESASDLLARVDRHSTKYLATD
jgi:hypothetical protein